MGTSHIGRIILLACTLLALVTACTGAVPETIELGFAITPEADQTLPPALKPVDSTATPVEQQPSPPESAETAVPASDAAPAEPTTAPQSAAAPTEPQEQAPTEPPPPTEGAPPAAAPATQTSQPPAAQVTVLPTAPANSTATSPPNATAVPQNTASAPAAQATQPPPAKTAPAFATATKQPTVESNATAVPTVEAPATSVGGGTLTHFANCASRTGGNATIAFPADTPISGGLALAAGDEVAIFDPGGTICAGFALWTGQNIALTAWGDDSQTEAVDGLGPSAVMNYVIWDDSEAVEYSATDVTYSLGDGVYTVDSIHAISAMALERR